MNKLNKFFILSIIISTCLSFSVSASSIIVAGAQSQTTNYSYEKIENLATETLPSINTPVIPGVGMDTAFPVQKQSYTAYETTKAKNPDTYAETDYTYEDYINESIEADDNYYKTTNLTDEIILDTIDNKTHLSIISKKINEFFDDIAVIYYITDDYKKLKAIYDDKYITQGSILKLDYINSSKKSWYCIIFGVHVKNNGKVLTALRRDNVIFQFPVNVNGEKNQNIILNDEYKFLGVDDTSVFERIETLVNKYETSLIPSKPKVSTISVIKEVVTQETKPAEEKITKQSSPSIPIFVIIPVVVILLCGGLLLFQKLANKEDGED